MSKWQVEYQGYYGVQSFASYEDALQEANLCVQAEFDAHNEGHEWEWDENVNGAVKIIKDGAVITESRLVEIKDGFYDLVMSRVKKQTGN